MLKNNTSPEIFDTLGSTRIGFGQGIVEAAAKDDRIVVVSADLDESLQLLDFKRKFPDRFIQVGVAEQNLLGVAAGLALAGKIPVAASYAVFSPGRSWDQLRVSICYSELHVIVVGGHVGLQTGPDGAAHQALEDIALTRVLPNLTVVAPCDQAEARKAIKAAIKLPGPVYLRVERTKWPQVTDDSSNFVIGQAETIVQGFQATVIACGAMVQQALTAIKSLEVQGYSVRLLNLSTIKPLDTAAILAACNETGAILTVEEHQINGGLGGAVAECILENQGINCLPPIFARMGVKDSFGESGLPQELLVAYGLGTSAIEQKIVALITAKQRMQQIL